MCIYYTFTSWSNTAVFMYAVCMLCVCSLRGLYILMRLKDETGLYASGYPSFFFLLFFVPFPLSHTVTRNKRSAQRFLSSTIRSVPAAQSRTSSYLHIHPRRINRFFNSASLRQSFAGHAIRDRRCTEYEL